MNASPFVPVPLGLLYGPGTVTVPTAAIREAVNALDAYLSVQLTADEGASARLESAGTGNVLAVIGEHGTGKTHLLMHLLQRAEESGEGRFRTQYLLARNRTFLELYLDLADALWRDADNVRARVRAIYAEIVAASLGASELTVRVADGLQDGELDPLDVVERLGLMESELLDRLRERLRQVTASAELATALTLLIRPAFEPAVWEWFLGRAPDPILQERGITTIINTEALALEAMGVFALLHHGAKHRFVLAIDEVEQILLAPERPDDVAISAFKRLLEMFAKADGFLLLAGLPEIVESLPAAVRQRIGRPVVMSPFTGADLRDMILESGRRAGRQPASLGPFTEETLDYVVSLVGGVARSAIKICSQLFLQATRTGADITPAMVREITRIQFNLGSTRSVKREIRHTLDASGWNYLIDHTTGRPPTTVDYWVIAGDADARCAIMLTDSVLNDDDMERLQRKVQAVRADGPHVELLLVVLGVIPRAHAQALTDLFRNEPLIYEPQTFGDEFEQAFKSMVDRVAEGQAAGDDELAAIRARLERIARQQTNVHGFIGEVSIHLDALRSSSDQRLLEIQHALGELRRDVGVRPVAEDHADLPPGVAALFTDASHSLHGLTHVEPLLRDAFGRVAAGARMPASGLAAGLRSVDAQRAVGVGVLLQSLVVAFRHAVRDWYRSVDAGAALVEDQAGALDSLCRTFDTIYRYLPVHRLEGLTDLTGRGSRPVDDDVIGLLPSVPEAMEGLGERVQRQVMLALPGSD